VEVYASETTIEIFVEADFETLPEEHRRFAILNVPREQFSQAQEKQRVVPERTSDRVLVLRPTISA
jgi:hypothetical protein